LWTYRRLHGSYPETAFEEVIEVNRPGTWTINAETVQVDFHFSDFPTNQALGRGFLLGGTMGWLCVQKKAHHLPLVVRAVGHFDSHHDRGVHVFKLGA
jgi:hypothetical protein